jgi:hypothetical protein
MDIKMFELTLEQMFELQCLQYEFQGLEREQVISYLVDTMEQLMVKDNLIRDLMKRTVL